MMDKTSAQPNSKQPQDFRTTTGASTPNAISDQIALLRKDLSGLAGTVTDLAKDHLGETIGDALHAALGKAGEVTAAIRANPMQATAIAAGVGFVVGLLLTR